MFSSPLFIIFIVFAALSGIASWQLRRRFERYSHIPTEGNLSGRDVAVKMLESNGIYNVSVVYTEGSLSDHYNPENRTVNLSSDVYHGRNVAAAAVAAHECGHAIQDANSYSFLRLRTMLVPLQNVSSKVLNFIFIAMFIGAFVLPNLMPMGLALQIIIVCYALFTIFAFITLPVEVDASMRAIAWLNSSGITSASTNGYAKDALKWAAYTYLIAALSSLATLLYYIMIYTSRRD